MLSRLVIASLMVLGSNACAENKPYVSKGFFDCPDGNVCVRVNSRTDAIFILKKPQKAPSVDIRYRYSNPEGNGKQKWLDNNSRLKTGDKFTVEVVAHEPMYVYLYHFDSHNQASELLKASGYSNYLKKGQSLMLPALDSHFVLDNNTGLESIHTLISRKPLNDLSPHYKKANQGKLTVVGLKNKNSYVTKGILAKKDGVRMIDCNKASACQGSFVIHHQ